MGTRIRIILAIATLSMLVVAGGVAGAHPDDEPTYPPAPPTETESELPTIVPTETPSPTESVLPTETVAPTETPSPTETPEVLPRVLERLPVTGSDLAVLFAAAALLVVGGVVTVRIGRRRHGSTDG